MRFLRKFGSHYAIERFGVLFLSLTLCMAMLLVSIVVRKVQYDRQSLSGKAVYTNSFLFSLTETEGSVRGVYVSEDQTKCMLLLRFDSMTDIPIDASEYALFLTGSDVNQGYTSLKSAPSGSLYLFGSTGYMGVYLYNASGFPSQILSLTIRSLNNFADLAEVDASGYDDASFARYNQARIYFNPGGSYATHAAFLDTDDWSVSDAYEEMVVRPYESSVRSTLRSDLISMHQQQQVMAEYTQRLQRQNIASPQTPAMIGSDKIYAVNPSDETKAHLTWSSQEDRWISEDGKRFPNEAVWLYLRTNQVVPGGYDFTWQDGSVREGYLQNLTGSDAMADWNAYFAEHTAAQGTSSASLNLDDVTWYYTDGSVFSPDTGDTSGSVTNSQQQAISENIASLTAAWEAYYTLKVQYQTVDLPELLHIESDLANVLDTYSVQTNEDETLLTLY